MSGPRSALQTKRLYDMLINVGLANLATQTQLEMCRPLPGTRRIWFNIIPGVLST